MRLSKTRRAWAILRHFGGETGPRVLIQRNNDPGFCEFEPPITDNCTASETYTANDTNFTNPADTWLWTIEPPVVGVDLTDATAKTCTVTTPTADTDLTFNLKVVATDSVSTDTANRTTTFTQKHIDTNEPPVFIGPNINDVQFQLGVPISPFDFSVLFTGTNLVYDEVASTLPAGLTLDPNTGILTGTPTTEQVELLRIGATNSTPVAAISNQFSMTIINQTQMLTVAEVSAGSCSYIYPQTVCTSQGTYDATPSGWTLPPDTWVWTISSVTQGSPVISSGQGTNTVTVDDTGAVDAQFTLKCVASNSTESAQDLTQFVQVHTNNTVPIAFDGPNISDQTFIVDELFTLDVSTLFSGNPIQTWSLLGTWPPGFSIDGSGVITGTPAIGDVGSYANLGVRAANSIPDSADSNTFNGTVQEAATGPAFLALTYDPDTITTVGEAYEMKGVVTGTGDLTPTHTADLYAPDVDGVYREFGANEAVWSGGRVVRNLAPYSEALDNVAWVVDADWASSKVLRSGIGPNGEDAWEFVSAGSATAQVMETLPRVAGHTYRLTMHVRAVGGDAWMDFLIAGNGSDAGPRNVVAPADTWVKVTDTQTSANTGNGQYGPRLFSDSPSLTIQIISIQVEDVSGQTNQNPGEYVPTTTTATQKTFASTNGNTVLNNVVTEAVGTPLAELPYLQYYPAAQNDCTYSNDLTNAKWVQAGGTSRVTTSYTEVGITGEPNTATLCTDDDGASSETVQNACITAAIGGDYCTVVYIKADADETRFPMVQMWLTTSATERVSYYLNTKSGQVTVRPGITYATNTSAEAIRVGDWWRFIIYAESEWSGSSNTGKVLILPAATSSLADPDTPVTTTGSIIVGNVEVHEGKTIAEVRGLGPIFTTTAAVATDITVYQMDAANGADDDTAWYLDVGPFEATDNIPLLTRNSFVTNQGIYAASSNKPLGFRQTSSLLSLNNAWQNNVVFQYGAVASEGFGNVRSEAVAWAADTAWTASSNWWTGMYVCNGQGTAPGITAIKFRNIQRYDITSYQNGKDIIDGLMS